jgi:hypothetical protein
MQQQFTIFGRYIGTEEVDHHRAMQHQMQPRCGKIVIFNMTICSL